MKLFGKIACFVGGHPWRSRCFTISSPDWDFMKFHCSRCGADYTRKKADIQAGRDDEVAAKSQLNHAAIVRVMERASDALRAAGKTALAEEMDVARLSINLAFLVGRIPDGTACSSLRDQAPAGLDHSASPALRECVPAIERLLDPIEGIERGIASESADKLIPWRAGEIRRVAEVLRSILKAINPEQDDETQP